MARRNNAHPTPVSPISSATPGASGRVMLGTLTHVEGPGRGQVDVQGASMTARTTLALEAKHVGSQVTLLLSEDEPRWPVILGVVLPADAPETPPMEARLDGKRVRLEAKTELVLRCGRASLTLTRDGKVVLRGAEVLQTSTGTHRIQGASVRIN